MSESSARMTQTPILVQVQPVIPPPRPKGWRHVDFGLSALLALQVLTLFVAIPLGTVSPGGRLLIDICHVLYALVCVVILTRHPVLRGLLIGSVAVLAAGPLVIARLLVHVGLGANFEHDTIAITAFAFNGAVTVLIARHVFAAGRVTPQRVLGAILLYLNIASLFSIAFSEIVSILPGAITTSAGALLPIGAGSRTAALTYFSLSTITTTGFGDLVPMHPLARSLANLESVIGQLFPATLLARLVALQLAHEPQ